MTGSREKGTPILIGIVSVSRNILSHLLIVRCVGSLDWPLSGRVLWQELLSLKLGHFPISSIIMTTWPLLV
jgi:hypothetical protein